MFGVEGLPDSSAGAMTWIVIWGFVDQWSVRFASAWKIVPKPRRTRPRTLTRTLKTDENDTTPL